MILHFSGTGNSAYVAKKIAEQTGDKLLDLNACIKVGNHQPVVSDKPWVIVVPTYAWQIPHVVRDWLLQTELSGAKDAYFLMTCGDSIGNAGEYAKKLCEEKGLSYRGMADVAMPENYITMFSAPSEDEEELIMEKARRRLKSVAETIARGGSLTQKSPKMKILSSLVNWGFYKFFVHDRGYFVKENCTGCGRCVKVCPLNDISIKEGKPVWGGSCTQCMACICGCPEEAIEYGKKSQGKRRYWCRNFGGN